MLIGLTVFVKTRCDLRNVLHFSTEGTHDPMSYKNTLRFHPKFATFWATGMYLKAPGLL
jgi:hypothetical protein